MRKRAEASCPAPWSWQFGVTKFTELTVAERARQLGVRGRKGAKTASHADIVATLNATSQVRAAEQWFRASPAVSS